MEKLRDFKVEHLYTCKDGNIFMGKIGNELAILKLTLCRFSDEELLGLSTKEYKLIQQNDIYYTSEINIEQEYTYTLICPATAEDMKKTKISYSYMEETYDEYLFNKKALKPENRVEVPEDRKLFEDGDFILRNDSETSDDGFLNWLLIFKNPEIQTLCDITDLSLIFRAKEIVLAKIEEIGIDKGDIFMYFDLVFNKTMLYLKILNISKTSYELYKSVCIVPLDTLITNLTADSGYYREGVNYIKAVNYC